MDYSDLSLIGSFLLGVALLVLTDPRVVKRLVNPVGSHKATSVRQRLQRKYERQAQKEGGPGKDDAPLQRPA